MNLFISSFKLINPKAYTKAFILSLLVLLSITMAFNRIIDPFWYYRDFYIPNINAVKTEFKKYDKQMKPLIFKELKPSVVIFGNSFFEVGLNPKHEALTQGGKYTSYNFGEPAADWNKVYCNVDYSLKTSNLQLVIIGIQAEPLPSVNCSQIMQNNSTVDTKTMLLSFDALRGSINTVLHQSKPPTHTSDGLFYYHRGNSGMIEQIFSSYTHQYVRFLGDRMNNPAIDLVIPDWNIPTHKHDFTGLSDLLQKLKQANVQVKIIVYPVHALGAELILNQGKIIDRWHYLYEIADLVEKFNTPDNFIELWDFHEYSDLNTERILNNHVKYWQDHGHFNYEFGDYMLDKIFLDKPYKSSLTNIEFGIKLTTNNIQNAYKSFFEHRKIFIQNNKWFLDDYNKFLN